jgi:hypothetical protein
MLWGGGEGRRKKEEAQKRIRARGVPTRVVALQSATVRPGRGRQTGRETHSWVVAPLVCSSACMHVERGRDKRRQMEKLSEDYWKKKGARRLSHVL